MRRNRRLTSSEHWDLGILLGVLILTFLGLTAFWQTGAIPRLYAFAFHAPTPEAPKAPATPTPAPILSTQHSELSTSSSSDPIPLPVLEPSASLSTTSHPKPVIEYKYFDGEKYRYLKTIRMRVTAYAPDRRCCWPYSGTTTASGQSVHTNHGQLVATDTNVIPFHCLVSIPGYHSGKPVPTLDRGSAIKGHRIDVLLPTFSQAQEWGSQLLDVKIYAPVDD